MAPSNSWIYTQTQKKINHWSSTPELNVARIILPLDRDVRVVIVIVRRTEVSFALFHEKETNLPSEHQEGEDGDHQHEAAQHGNKSGINERLTGSWPQIQLQATGGQEDLAVVAPVEAVTLDLRSGDLVISCQSTDGTVPHQRRPDITSAIVVLLTSDVAADDLSQVCRMETWFASSFKVDQAMGSDTCCQLLRRVERHVSQLLPSDDLRAVVGGGLSEEFAQAGRDDQEDGCLDEETHGLALSSFGKRVESWRARRE